MSVKIQIVASRADLRRFVDFPEWLYRDCENWVPALRGDEFDTFDKDKNGAYAYCESECYLAWKDGRVAGSKSSCLSAKI